MEVEMPTKEFPGASRITCEDEIALGRDFSIGPDVHIQCRHLSVGDSARIGTTEDEDGFRYPGGVRIRVDELILGDKTRIGRHVLIRGGRISLGSRVRIGNGVTIHVLKQLILGDESSIQEQCEVSGMDIVIGRRLWMLPQAKIGGGSAFEVHSSLRIGDWCHLGTRSLVNTACQVTIGDEVGLGTGTCLYTHGAYASALDGKPVAFGPISIGDRTWIPGAIVNPFVKIGKDCVIGVGSVVTRDIPDGSLAAGIPAKVLRENAYPRPLSGKDRLAFFSEFIQMFAEICSDQETVTRMIEVDPLSIGVGDTLIVYQADLTSHTLANWTKECFSHLVVLTDHIAVEPDEIPPNVTVLDFIEKRLIGEATPIAERLVNQLRRYGIRFNYGAEDGYYVAWK